MTYGVNAKVLEIISGQTGQQFGGDVILSECRLVAFEPERSQPIRDVHYRSLPRRAAVKNDAIGADLSRENRALVADQAPSLLLAMCAVWRMVIVTR